MAKTAANDAPLGRTIKGSVIAHGICFVLPCGPFAQTLCTALIAMPNISNNYIHPRALLKFNLWLHFFHFPGTRSGESAGGSLVGIVPGGSIFSDMSGTFTWALEEVEMVGESPRHSLRLLPGPESSY